MIDEASSENDTIMPVSASESLDFQNPSPPEHSSIRTLAKLTNYEELEAVNEFNSSSMKFVPVESLVIYLFWSPLA